MTVMKPISAQNPKISVVIPTLPSNSHDEVVACLKEQTFDSYEVLVVNDVDLDICEARNSGIKAASGDIVALTDDDCRPDPEWLRNVWDEFDASSNLVCLEGAVHGGRTYNGTRRYVGCNISFNREAALAVGGFNSDYAGWRDDTEFGWRMERDAGGSCRYSQRVKIHHPDLPRAGMNEELEMQLKREYPNRYENILVPDSIIGSINDWLWRHGFWDMIDSIRYNTQK
ncbi:glycosyltransferase family 2 protein [Haladaptatus salinisoli]|uniref:glycosyltransferase family 2 protein n=1 Tax=Haladaptatus salinisoli TaxID=2884876 RepID=UPI001D0A9438|nr:glycosyltransferase family A protein [Haladaptatus salinisoli]